jgi:transposase
MMGKKDFKPRIFYRLSLEKMVPQDHLVRALEEILDINFIRGLCRKYYSHTGQPSVDPIVLFKMMLLGYLFGITSERKLAEECTVNLAFRWYLGYDLDEATPNHSVISKARRRFGKKVFEEFFRKVLGICVEKGLVKGEKIFADGTLIKANASLKSLVARSDALSPSLSPNEYVGLPGKYF